MNKFHFLNHQQTFKNKLNTEIKSNFMSFVGIKKINIS